MKFKSKLFLLKEYIKKKFDLWNYDEKAKINEIQYIINYLKENHLNNIGNTHIDLGGGNGLYSYRMHQEGFLPETEVVDYYVEQQFNFQHYKVQLENLNLKKKYNIITCMLVLELVNDRDKIIESISRLADRDTIIIFSFPNINSIEHKFIS